MNYTENNNTERKASSHDDKGSHYYQKSNTNQYQKKLSQDNKSATVNSHQTSESQSRLNYKSTPFIPQANYSQPHYNLSETSADSRELPYDHDGNFYKQNSNLGHKSSYGGNFGNPYPYNHLDFMQYAYPVSNNGSSPNCWPNAEYYGAMNVGPSNTSGTNQISNFNSKNIRSGQQYLEPENSPDKQNSKKTNTEDEGRDEPTNVSVWTDNSVDKITDKFSQLNFKTAVNNDTNFGSFDKETFNEIIDSVNDPQIKKRLKLTLKAVNPKLLLLKNLTRARFFVIKSYTEDDLHRAIKYEVWCSTLPGNNALDEAYRELRSNVQNQEAGRLFLFFSVAGSGFFAGIAEMISTVDFDTRCKCWTQDKWRGKIEIRWHYVKDVRNSSLRHIRSDANDKKPVTNSKDAVEVTPMSNGIEFIKVFHNAKHQTSVFDDFGHYEKREQDEKASKNVRK